MQYSIVDAASVKLHFILIILNLQITIRDNLTCMQENKQAGPSVIQYCRKTLHSSLSYSDPKGTLEKITTLIQP